MTGLHFSGPQRVLLADNSPRCDEIAQYLRDWSYSPVVVSSGADALDSIDGNDAPRLVVLRWQLPEMTGPEICFQSRHRDSDSYTYFILIAPNSDCGRINGFNSGADSVLFEGFDKNELRVRLTAGDRILQLEDRLKAANEMIRCQATRDHLTGIHNRRSVMDQIEIEITRSRRGKSPLGLIIIDIDEFKSVNDDYGHPIGDHALQHTAHNISKSTRPFDIVGRYGGDEFIVVLPDADAAATSAVADRIVRAAMENPLRIENRDIQVTLSCGALSLSALEDVSINSMVQLADEALYRAKRNGRNQTALAGPQPAESVN